MWVWINAGYFYREKYVNIFSKIQKIFVEMFDKKM